MFYERNSDFFCADVSILAAISHFFRKFYSFISFCAPISNDLKLNLCMIS